MKPELPLLQLGVTRESHGAPPALSLHIDRMLCFLNCKGISESFHLQLREEEVSQCPRFCYRSKGTIASNKILLAPLKGKEDLAPKLNKHELVVL